MKTYVLKTPTRKITVQAKDEEGAYLKAREGLDRRMIRAGQEPPVAHTFVSIEEVFKQQGKQ